uniref:MoaF-related domain-containing protein n=1 Tax=Candidatus Electrothrix sp. TaxID=2170559 RepID=UPI004056F954
MKGIMKIAAVMVMSLLMLTTNLIAEESKVENITPDIVGKTYLFDYGEYAYDITITSDKSLHWKLVKGSFEGPSTGDNPYLSSKIADNVLFISWKEESGYQFYNVMDLNTGKLTTHANADGMSVNMGKVSLKK